MSALDATFLELEQADEGAHMHTGAILVFDPPPGGAPPSYEQLCARLERVLAQLPRYLQRLSTSRAGRMWWPDWEDDETFVVTRHVARAALPTPGDAQELSEWASDFFSHRLDRRHPLWEMVLIEGLAGGRWALATKTHHCMVDGVGSVDVVRLLLDDHAQPQDPQAERGGSWLAPSTPASVAPLPRRLSRVIPGDALVQAGR